MTQKKKVEQKKNSRNRVSWLRTAIWALGLAAWVGGTLFISQLLIAKLFVLILPEYLLANNVVNGIYSVVVYAVCMVLAIGLPWWVLKKKTTRDELGLRGLPTWLDLLLAPVGLVVVMIVAGILTTIMVAILPSVDWQQAQEVGFHGLYDFGEHLLAFICLVIIAPVCEEIVFRGWLYGKLRVRLTAVPAMLIVSLLFGIMHGQWNVGVTVFAMSLGMCAMRELTGTIWSGVILHMIKNGIAFYALFVLM